MPRINYRQIHTILLFIFPIIGMLNKENQNYQLDENICKEWIHKLSKTKSKKKKLASIKRWMEKYTIASKGDVDVDI